MDRNDFLLKTAFWAVFFVYRAKLSFAKVFDCVSMKYQVLNFKNQGE